MKPLASALVALFLVSPFVPVARAQRPPAPSGTISNYCEPGTAGVMGCPCSNPPAGSGQGCDNSTSTGGAILSGAGVCILPTDTLVLTTAFERSNALSILAEGLTTVPAGAVFGMGVRCYNTIKRLYTKTASVTGVITVPSGSDPVISVRSAQRGDTLVTGSVRYYFVYYRDPVLVGSCTTNGRFNASQGLEVTW